jgi:transcriptional regulator with PAS, ATPase and Fis domain
MEKVLITWVGETDLKASKGEARGLGPIADAAAKREFDHVVLLSDWEKRKPEIVAFKAWLETRTKAAIELRHEKLRAPTDYGDIYGVVSRVVPEVCAKYGKGVGLTFHLSPGTPAMGAIWILVAAKYGAKLIQTSPQQGLQDANLPFEIAAEFVPALVRQADAELERLSTGNRPEDASFKDILHRSPALKSLLEKARQAAPYSAAILIEGESGTGKELLAAAIHKASGRTGAFVPVNCGALPKDLVESIFFGHKKGAFTGAVADQTGRFEQAHDGTLFLDEIGELPLDAQVSLLRVLEDKKFQRIGEKTEHAADFRVVAATNRDLLDEVAAGRFREDLYYRLGVLLLKTPPLREREGDVLLLIQRHLEKLNAERPPSEQKTLSPAAKTLLLAHPWPGNVRELHSTLLRAFVWSRASTIDEAAVREGLVRQRPDKQVNLLEKPLGNGFELRQLLADVARHYLERALGETHGNKTQAAKLVGFASYQTLTNWARKHGVEA